MDGRNAAYSIRGEGGNREENVTKPLVKHRTFESVQEFLDSLSPSGSLFGT